VRYFACPGSGRVGVFGGRMLPILLMEPNSISKRRHLSKPLMGRKRVSYPSFEDIKRQLREIRNYSLAHQDALLNKLITSLATDPEVEFSFAKDTGQAVETIKRISDCTSIAVSKSAVASKELTPALEAQGFHIIETYYDQFEPFENRFNKPWQLPSMEFESMLEAFDESNNLRNLWSLREASIRKRGSKDFTGLLGVNAISAREGAVLLIQHMQNISTVFEQAKKLILVASLDKIVENLDDAVIQTKCTGVFGCGVLPLSLHGKANQHDNIDNMPFEIPPEQTARKIHLIIFDNGRRQLLHSRYEDLLACIGCRACTKGCPSLPFLNGNTPWSPKEYIYFFVTGKNPSLELCLQCRNCQADCPLDIDLPGMILHARTEAMAKSRRSLTDTILSNFETIAKCGSSMPLLANVAANNRLMRWLGEKVLGINKERQLPRFRHTTLAKWFRLSADKSVDEI